MKLKDIPDFHLHLATPIAAIVVGILLLFLGRKLFWLFVGAIGFVVGADAAATMFPQHSEWVLIFGVVLGLVGALVAILVQKIAIGVGGFLAGGYFLMIALRESQMQAPQYSWVPFLIGGCIGAMLMFFVFDWALILFSSISGAHLITQSLALHQMEATVVFVLLTVIGLGAQGKLHTSARRRTE